MRVYPKATRIDSSNYNPLIGWTHGAQMVAFNMQVNITMLFFWKVLTDCTTCIIYCTAHHRKIHVYYYHFLYLWKIVQFSQETVVLKGHGRSLWLMQGMFRANGGCGYVKKPDCLLKLGPNNEVFDPKRKDLPVKKTLKVDESHFFLLFWTYIDQLLIYGWWMMIRWKYIWAKVGILIFIVLISIYIRHQIFMSR